MRSDELDRLDRQIRGASRGPALAYAEVLERAIAVCDEDPNAVVYLDVLELHSELAEAYDRLGWVEEALRHADVLVEHGYRCEPDPRCRRAEILTRHGRLAEAAQIWEAVAADTPDDVWVYNNAGLEYGAIGEHELALSWLTRALELTVRTGDPERLVGQLRDLRAASLTKLGREPDGLQSSVPTPAVPGRWESPTSLKSGALVEREIRIAGEPAGQVPVAVAWLPADEYAAWPQRWPDLADSPLLHDEVGEPVSHAVYCRRMEGRLRAHRESGVARLSVVPVRSAEFHPWVADNAPEEPDPSQLRARYAADVARDPSRRIAWPPGRNEACWCGSGRKYKRCCGAPGAEQSPQ
ncbi:MAG: SEC-C metal-binding domain-containing protein [Candidatus Nanopelagicales bacterium]